MNYDNESLQSTETENTEQTPGLSAENEAAEVKANESHGQSSSENSDEYYPVASDLSLNSMGTPCEASTNGSAEGDGTEHSLSNTDANEAVGMADDASVGAEYTLEGDISALMKEIPSLRDAVGGGINGARYSELRRLGLSAREAYLAASCSSTKDTRSHMVTGVPLGASSPSFGMSSSEMELARGLFSGMAESEIKRLYAKVTK